MRHAVIVGGLLLLAACAKTPSDADSRLDAKAPALAATLDNTVLSNEQDGANWAAFGRTFSEGHYSPLAEINAPKPARPSPPNSSWPNSVSPSMPKAPPASCCAICRRQPSRAN